MAMHYYERQGYCGWRGTDMQYIHVKTCPKLPNDASISFISPFLRYLGIRVEKEKQFRRLFLFSSRTIVRFIETLYSTVDMSCTWLALTIQQGLEDVEQKSVRWNKHSYFVNLDFATRLHKISDIVLNIRRYYLLIRKTYILKNNSL